MDYYKCENCGNVFNEFEMNYRAAQVDKKCLCPTCRESTKEACKSCGQIPSGQGGEYPCPVCGIPTMHDGE